MKAVFLLLAVCICACAGSWTKYKFALTESFWRWNMNEVELYSDSACTQKIALDEMKSFGSPDYNSETSRVFDGQQGSRWATRWENGRCFVGIELSSPEVLACVRVWNGESKPIDVLGFNEDEDAWYLWAESVPIVGGDWTQFQVTAPDTPERQDPCVDGFCSTSWRVRQKTDNWLFGANEVQFYYDPSCTEVIPLPESGTAYYSNANKGDPRTAFDLSTKTKVVPITGPDGSEHIGFTWPYEVAVRCVKIFADRDAMYVDAFDEARNEWVNLGDFDGLTANEMSEALTLEMPAESPYPPANVAIEEFTMSADFTGEYKFTMRHLRHNGHKHGIPRRMFPASCEAAGRFIVGWTDTSNQGHISVFEKTNTPGDYNLLGDNVFPECIAMYGVTYSFDCNKIYAMCRAVPGMSGAIDLIHPLGLPQTFTEPIKEGVNYMYLLTLNALGSQRTDVPYIIHKGIGSWEYGNNLIVASKDGGYLSYVCKAFMHGNHGTHEADSSYTIDLSTMQIDYQNYGDYWACGPGHTLFQRLSYNPTTNLALHFCGTDLGRTGSYGMFTRLNVKEGGGDVSDYDCEGSITPNGGPGGVAPYGEGWLATFIRRPTLIGDCAPHKDKITKIGLAHLDSDGRKVGDIMWIETDPNHRIASSQIAPLPNGNFLLGYGLMFDVRMDTNSVLENYVPQRFLVVEIDAEGDLLTETKEVVGGGWGEQDNWITLDGKVIWPYTWYESPVVGDSQIGGLPGNGYADDGKTSNILRIHTYLAEYAPAPPVTTPVDPPTEAAPQYVGCFQDGGQRTLPHNRLQSSMMDVALCSDNCAGYTYFGLQYRSECWCGNTMPPTPKPEGDCSMNCSGDSSVKCGAGWRNSVYEH